MQSHKVGYPCTWEPPDGSQGQSQDLGTSHASHGVDALAAYLQHIPLGKYAKHFLLSAVTRH